MRDSLEDLELGGGGRFSEMKNPDAPHPAASSLAPQQLRRAISGKHVCPFCGAQRETDIGSCPNCSLEDSPTTRSATRSKLGPWYVLQSRNPSAPGMNFATLMVLVQKGRVTARSIVRGPTTGQFWRHAARVKGVSREFGLCWSCGGDVAKNARACAACKKHQEPPADPDVLLEAGAEVNDDELAEAMWADHVPGAPANESPRTNATARPATFSSKPVERPASPVDRLVARGGVRREVAPVTEQAVARPASPVAGTASASRSPAVSRELPPSDLDMAVFQRSQKRGVGQVATSATRKVLKTLFVAVLMLCSGVVAMASFDPGMREKLIVWVDKGKGWATQAMNAVRNAKPAEQADAGGAPGAVSQQQPASPEQAKQRVWELWKVGVEAERKGEFTAAVKAWEQIKGIKVAEEDVPLGLDARIAAAKKRMK
jgi:hypothetical protein